MAIFVAAAFLALPIMVSAGDETIIPPEVNWSSTPPTPAHLMVPQERVVSTAQELASDMPRRSIGALSREDASYKAVTDTMNDDWPLVSPSTTDWPGATASSRPGPFLDR